MRPIVAALVVAVISAAPAAKAQNAAKPDCDRAHRAGGAGTGSSSSRAPEPYQPGLGEIMALQQMRHISFWFAGRSGNWRLADYEIGELKEGFEDVSGLLGSDIVNEHVGTPIAALEKAIDGKNKADSRRLSISSVPAATSATTRSVTASLPSSGRRRCPIATKPSRRSKP